MDELVKTVSQKTGLSEDQARAASQAVLDYLMTKLPQPVSAQIKNALQGSGMPDLSKGVGGMFGK
ncbi:MAG: hypothetical protein ACM3JD_18500 [Rudaea sp.]